MMSAKVNFFLQTRKFQRPSVSVPAFSSFAEAYAIQCSVFQRDDRAIAWKLGGVNHWTRKAFQVERIYAGPVSHEAIIPVEPIMAPQDCGIQCHGELEILVRLGDINAFTDGNITIDEVISAIAPALECPASVLKFPDDGIYTLIADCCGAGTIIHGEWLPWRAYEDIHPSDNVILSSDSEVLAKGIYENLIDGVANIVKSFCALAHEHDLPVKPGDLIATGGITPCVPLPHDQILTVSLSGLGDFSFMLRNDNDD